jgi:Holliday junction resolvase RusA-like endonuclease
MDKYVIEIDPQPAPRPRLGKYGAYNTSKYTNHKENLSSLIKSLNIVKDDYDYIHAVFYFKYPKSTPKKHRIEGKPKRDKCDNDNLIKPLLDVLEKINVIENDRQFTDMFIQKKSTTKNVGRIEFYLQVPLSEKNYIK